MIKIIDLGCEFPGTFEKRVSLLDESLIKTASNDIQHFWNTFERKKDKGYIHVIAMSAGEWYSSNNNGDIFSEANLREYHSSFVRDGNIFLFHMNRDPKQSLGKPIFSFYNDLMHRVELVLEFSKNDPKAKLITDKIKNGEELYVSMGCKVSHDECSICHNKAKTRQNYCFIPDTYVTMYDGCVNKISEIKEGDLLLDADGRITEVVATMSREIDENIVKFKTTINNFETQCTKNHPILSTTREDAGVCYYIKYVRDNTRPCLPNSRLNCKTCQKSEFIKEFRNAADLRVRDIIYAPYPDYTNFSNNDITPEDAWIIGLFAAEGCYAKNKLVSGETRKCGIIFNLNSELEGPFAERILNYFNKKYNINGSIRLRSDCKGMTVYIGSLDIAEQYTEYVGEYSATKYFSTNLFYSQLKIIEELVSGFWDGDGYNGHPSYCGTGNMVGSLLAGISPNTTNQTLLLLYLLGQDAYYTVPPQFSRKGRNYSTCYKVISDYRNTSALTRDDNMNSPRGRTDTHIVGYIKSIEETSYNGIVHNLETTSGTYIANGIAVHNCDHLRYNMNKILPNGEKVVAVNPAPYKFFDISIVNRPADKMAYALQKEASQGEEPTQVISSAELGEQYEDTQAKLASLKKISDMIKFIDGDIADVDNLDETTKSHYNVLKQLKNQKVHSLDYPVMNFDDLEEMDASPGAVIRVFINAGVPPSLGEIAYAAGKHQMGDAFRQNMIPQMLEMLPVALAKLINSPDSIEPMVSNLLSNYKGELENPEISNRLNSLVKPTVTHRITIIKQACEQKELEKLAADMHAGLPSYHHLPHKDQSKDTGLRQLARDIVDKNVENGYGVLGTTEITDHDGKKYITNDSNIMTARIQDSIVPTGATVVGGSIMMAGLLSLISDATLLQKVLTSLAGVGIGGTIMQMGQLKSRTQTSQGMEIPNNTIFSRVHTGLSKIGTQQSNAALHDLWKNNKSTVVGMAVPGLLGLDYLYNKHIKYKNDPYLEENLSPVGKMMHRAGRVVVQNPATSIIGGGMASTVGPSLLKEMLKKKPKV